VHPSCSLLQRVARPLSRLEHEALTRGCGVGEGLVTGVAVVCLAAARGVGVGVRWQLVVEEEGAGVADGLE
jgi:hypothetical protein